jgi:hypothetical protein
MSAAYENYRNAEGVGKNTSSIALPATVNGNLRYRGRLLLNLRRVIGETNNVSVEALGITGRITIISTLLNGHKDGDIMRLLLRLSRNILTKIRADEQKEITKFIKENDRERTANW